MDYTQYGIAEDGSVHENLTETGVDINSPEGLLRQLALSATVVLFMHKSETSYKTSLKSLSIFEVNYPKYEARDWRSLLSQDSAERLFVAMRRLRDAVTVVLAEKEAGYPSDDRSDLFNQPDTFAALRAVREAAAIVERPRSPEPPPEDVEFDTAATDATGKNDIASLLLDEIGQKIVETAQSKMSVHDRMMRIYDLDMATAGWTSKRWADLLGVTSSAVRQTKMWELFDRLRNRDD